MNKLLQTLEEKLTDTYIKACINSNIIHDRNGDVDEAQTIDRLKKMLKRNILEIKDSVEEEEKYEGRLEEIEDLILAHKKSIQKLQNEKRWLKKHLNNLVEMSKRIKYDS